MTPTQKKIDRAYQRAMDIRDSTPGRVGLAVEDQYMNSYRSAYRNNDPRNFSIETRRYLKLVREAGRNE